MTPIENAPYFEAAKTELAHTGADIVWHERNADRAVVLSVLPGYKPWYHLFLEIDGEWLPVLSSFDNWLSYETPDYPGVLVDVSPVAEGVDTGRVLFRGRTDERPVHKHHLCVVFWDVRRPVNGDRPQYLSLRIDGEWTECVSPRLPATARHFAESYIRYHQPTTKAEKDRHWWAVDAFFDADFDEKPALVLAVVDHAGLPGDEVALGALGAGPLEEMMREELLDRLASRIQNDAKLRYALGAVRMSVEPEPLQRRLAALMAGRATSEA